MAEDAGLFDGVFSRGAAATDSQAWLRAMLDTEAALARALERAGLAPPGAGAAVTEAAATAAFDPGALGRRAALTGNPVPALVADLRKAVPPDAADTVHRGATSQDIIDTAAMLLARAALDRLADDLAAAADGCAVLAAAHRDTIMIGRTLLQQAVPVTFGLVAAGWLTGVDEAADAVARVRAARLAVQFGGAAGTLASLGADGPAVAAARSSASRSSAPLASSMAAVSMMSWLVAPRWTVSAASGGTALRSSAASAGTGFPDRAARRPSAPGSNGAATAASVTAAPAPAGASPARSRARASAASVSSIARSQAWLPVSAPPREKTPSNRPVCSATGRP